MASKLEQLRVRLMAVDMLRAAKAMMTYRQLRAITGVDETVLAKYVAGSMVPSYEQAERIWRSLSSVVGPRSMILSRVRELEGVLDLSPVLSDPLQLRLASMEFLDRFRGEEVTKILVPETSGISLATAISMAFNVGMVVARRRKENPLIEYVEEHIAIPPRISRVFYVPRGSITGSDRVLIVDDIVQTGYTLAVMEKLVSKSGGGVVGVAALVVVGERWREVTGIGRVEALVRIQG